jgi:DNA-binding MarR family transcriptional regulator
MEHDELLNHEDITYAYRLAYILNFYREPLLKDVETKFGLSRPEWTVLLCLSRQPGLISRDICAITGQARNSISRGVGLLERKGLIRRTPDGKDGRRNVLELTPAGRAVYDRIVPHFQTRERAMIGCLDDDELARLDGLLTKLCRHVPDWASDPAIPNGAKPTGSVGRS